MIVYGRRDNIDGTARLAPADADEWANTNSEVEMMKDEGGSARLADVQ